MWLCGRSLAGIAGSIVTGGMDVCVLMSVVCCPVEVSAKGRSPVQWSTTECGVSEYNRELSTTRKSDVLYNNISKLQSTTVRNEVEG